MSAHQSFGFKLALQPRNYQFSKEFVYELDLRAVAVMQIINNLQYSDMHFNTDWQFEMIKRGKEGHDTWYINVNFK